MNPAKAILIVDGSAIMRRVIERALRLAGLESGQIFEASDGAEALDLARQRHLDLILTDLNLTNPGTGASTAPDAAAGAPVSGMDLLRQLRETDATSAVPVVVITSQAGESFVLEALALGARAYIRKPFTADQIKEYVAPLFRHPSPPPAAVS